MVALLADAIDPSLNETWSGLDPTLLDCAAFSVDAALEFVGVTGTGKLRYMALGADLRVFSEGLVQSSSDRRRVQRTV